MTMTGEKWLLDLLGVLPGCGCWGGGVQPENDRGGPFARCGCWFWWRLYLV